MNSYTGYPTEAEVEVMVSSLTASAPAFTLETLSGNGWSLISGANRVDFREIAHALALTNRFGGHTHLPYSVAQHSCLVADMAASEARPYALLHDAHEAYLGDLTGPLLQLLRTKSHDFAEEWQRLREKIDGQIHAAAGLAPVGSLGGWIHCEIRMTDLRALATEQRDLLPDDGLWLPNWGQPYSATIHPWPWAKAEHEFWKRACRWLPALMGEAE